MELTDVERLFKGVGVIIDDEAETIGKPAHDILVSLQEAHIPMLVYDDIPALSLIDSLANISFIILDWEFSSVLLSDVGIDKGESEEVVLPESLLEEQKHTILDFLKALIAKVFVPVFVFTGQDFEKVKRSLMDEGIYEEGKPNRILLKSKAEISNYSTLIEHVKYWLETTPSAQVLKLWESEAVIAKNRMFLDMYAASPHWVSILLRILKDDTKDKRTAVNQEFTQIMNNNFINRISPKQDYYSVYYQEDDKNPRDIQMVLQGERYITYDQEALPVTCYVGDLYKMKEDQNFPYRLNIRAQCDLLRTNNPDLFLLSGRVFPREQVTTQPGVKVIQKDEEKVLTIDQNCYRLKELLEEDQKSDTFNKEMRKYNHPVVFSYGDIIEKKTHSIVACVAGELFIEFCFRKFEVGSKTDIETKATKIGRLLPPYITKIQNAFASFMIRTGVTPIPEELLTLPKN